MSKTGYKAEVQKHVDAAVISLREICRLLNQEMDRRWANGRSMLRISVACEDFKAGLRHVESDARELGIKVTPAKENQL